MRTIKKLQDFDIKGKRVFVRVDFNVPLRREGDAMVVTDASRIEGALATIKYVIENEGKCVLASHLGRPGGKPSAKYSLEPAGKKLSELLDRDVILTDDCIGDGARGLSQQMRPGEILLLENLRFHAGEENNGGDFAAKLLELCDVFINDAFGALHRAHASTSALPKLVTEKGIGFLVQKELEYLDPLRDSPQRPFVLVMGGAKVSDKIGVLDRFIDKADRILIGGAMAYAFLKAKGREVGKSLCDDRQVSLAAKLLKAAEVRKVEFYLPLDHVAVTAIDKPDSAVTTPTDAIPIDRMGVDIGPKTIQSFRTALQDAETIFWNGPMGVFEQPAFAVGTNELAKVISTSKAKKLAGGGDVSAAIQQSGTSASFDFVSTGGGATLEYLEGKELPGLKALEVLVRSSS